MGALYLVALAIALAGMVVLDRRFRLFFWHPAPHSARRAGIVLVVGVVFFLGWDVAGIRLGIFFRGETAFMTGVQLAPELPLEEVLFLTLLCYLAMNAYGALARVIPLVEERTSAARPRLETTTRDTGEHG
ncbi:lycopene cyclase domain-containing protein [Galbitalea sp. SE-J8]|uniref:lycopene cyclase domain-containing protein n=1 Tax=Galbitalea sp. SE-J8 TaxID=3054952 RepID=UPI00259D1C1E|nr:lycopene cyclase domain-containing protein [Galbitalea sp. SE-J8]MDM4762291.1 lycopene cyclase domain-containing protein [Galbitalea sp. SE-J8]